jgi:hypothetical protein
LVDADCRTVRPVDEWLEEDQHLWSPNAVRGYARSLAQWSTFLGTAGAASGWREVEVPAVMAFLSWLRN